MTDRLDRQLFCCSPTGLCLKMDSTTSSLTPSNDDTTETCTLLGIDWSTGGNTCVSEHGYVLLVALIIGVFIACTMMWFSATYDDSDEASDRAVYEFERDFWRWPGWPWESTPEDEQRRKERQELRYHETAPLLHSDEAWCDYCAMIEQRRAQRAANYGCIV